ncbi:MAG: 5-(carboxyamino)imidazole ribonucleotide mutase [SAR86 cluster bacterium]|jgi:5-(carboxyamino)imidazole ribonucleotide mutase
MGSESDLDLANKCGEVLSSFSIDFSVNVFSAHRTPDLLEQHLEEAEKGNTQIYIAIAGLAAHLAGAIASKTVKPVIGIPADGGPLNGFDSLLSTVQMPKGVPVATVAIGSAGAANAGYLAAQILSLSSKKIADNLLSIREANKQQISEVNKKLSKK